MLLSGASAAKRPSLAERLKDDVNCVLCCEQYDQGNHCPKAFPCLHTFCLVCVATLMENADGPTFQCPLCKESTVKHSHATDYKTNLFIASVVEYLDSSEERRCAAHPRKSVSHVCTHCWQLMCSECLNEFLRDPAASAPHAQHIVDIEEAFPQAREMLMGYSTEMLTSLESKLDNDFANARAIQNIKKTLCNEMSFQELVNDEIFEAIKEIERFHQTDEFKKENHKARCMEQYYRKAQASLKKDDPYECFMTLRECQIAKKQLGSFEIVPRKFTVPQCISGLNRGQMLRGDKPFDNCLKDAAQNGSFSDGEGEEEDRRTPLSDHSFAEEEICWSPAASDCSISDGETTEARDYSDVPIDRSYSDSSATASNASVDSPGTLSFYDYPGFVTLDDESDDDVYSGSDDNQEY